MASGELQIVIDPHLDRTPTTSRALNDDHASLYYAGIGSIPKLVARSSTKPWGPELGPWTAVSPVAADHPIIPKWNDLTSELHAGIRATLRNVPYMNLDLIRIGRHGDENLPTIIWVGVPPGSTSADVAVSAVSECCALVERLGFDKIECEIRECSLFPAGLSQSIPYSAGEPESDTTDNHCPSQIVLTGNIMKEQIDLELSDYTGTCISTLQNGHEGTKGLYLRINGKTYALTCRYVVD
jgi:hypothetical protein